MAKRCERCLGPMPLMARAHARFCSGRCRTAASRARAPELPRELTSRPRWIRHAADKVPLTCAGRPASVTVRRTWSDYATAAASDAGAGLGFVLDGDGIVCVDLDHCLEGGELAPWAARILAMAPAAYVEVSPSGHGLHLWGFAAVGAGRVIRGADGLAAEVYGQGRYITVTGRRYGSRRQLGDISAAVAALTG